MPITINGSGTVTGISAGGLPDDSIVTADIANGAVTQAKRSEDLTLATAQNTTSGTSIDFTGIPSWVKRVTVMFNGVSTNGTSNLLLRLGTSGGIQTSTYTGRTIGGQTTMNGALDWTNGVELQHSAIVAATDVLRGSVIFNLIDAAAFAWAVTGGLIRTVSIASSSFPAGGIVLTGAVTTLRLTTSGGTDTFDAGSINILYE